MADAGMTSIESINLSIRRLQSQEAELEVIWQTDEWDHFIRPQNEPAGSSPAIPLISVLDSSFNPPTLAHLALALLPPIAPSSSQPPPSSHAYILLLSVRNADKQLKPGDPTLAQRVQMMILLAQAIHARLIDARAGSGRGGPSPCIMVAVIDEPTFVGKSQKLVRYFRSQLQLGTESALGPEPTGTTLHDQPIPPRLTFIVGWDTIIRVFNVKYYGTREAMNASLGLFFKDDRSSMVCARRSTAQLQSPRSESENASARKEEEEEEEAAFLGSDDVKEYVESGVVKMVDLDGEVASLSSTLVRASMARNEGDNDEGRHQDGDDMLVPTIAEYIRREGLYLSSA
ncbi:hypothetical protein DL93DRAFT_2071395 [Clavulina sp. PMI_390]|nr:hypothetical protein DL93DRAFT_2071395 [Clavulina sp. PMI_390]